MVDRTFSATRSNIVAAEGGVSACQASACASNSIDWGCADSYWDCTFAVPSQICCALGASIAVGGPECVNTASGFTRTSCTSTRGYSAGIRMCTFDGECPNGQKCVPFVAGGNQVGGCM
jgi:hypothetical protein